MQNYRIYLIRHGMTASNLEGRFIGRTDAPLCPQGAGALKKLCQTAEYPGVGALYASPLARCVQTACLLYPKMDIITVPNLREYDFGDFENKRLSELKTNEAFLRFLEENQKNPPPGGSESVAQFQARVLEGFEQVLRDMMKKRIFDAALVTHGGVMMTLLGACGLPREKASHWTANPGEGYGVLVNTAIWSNSRAFEIGGKIPFTGKETPQAEYHFVEPDYIRRVDQSMNPKTE